MKVNVFAKKGTEGNDVTDARMDGLDIQTVSLVNAQVKDPHPRRVSVTRTADSVRVKSTLVGANVTSALLGTTITLIALLAAVTVWGLMGCLARIMEFVAVKKTLLEKSAMNVPQRGSTTLCVKNVIVTLMVSPNTSSPWEAVLPYRRENCVSANRR